MDVVSRDSAVMGRAAGRAGSLERMNLRGFTSMFAVCGALALSAGCTIKINDTDGDSASGSSGGGSSGGGSTTVEPATSDGSDSMPATSTITTEGSGTDTQTGGATTGEPSTTTSTSGSTTGGSACGCADNEFCAFKLQSCGSDPNDVGVCMPKPDGCDAVYQPACGCDGMVYGNACDAALAGIDVSQAGGCVPPDGYFACGAGFCDIKTSYCQVQLSDVVGEPDVFTCLPLPGGCDPLDCACLKGEACADMCENVGGGLTVNCPGG